MGGLIIAVLAVTELWQSRMSVKYCASDMPAVVSEQAEAAEL